MRLLKPKCTFLGYNSHINVVLYIKEVLLHKNDKPIALILTLKSNYCITLAHIYIC